MDTAWEFRFKFYLKFCVQIQWYIYVKTIGKPCTMMLDCNLYLPSKVSAAIQKVKGKVDFTICAVTKYLELGFSKKF